MWAPDLKFLKEVQAHPCSIFSITASDDTLYSCSNDGTVKSWDLESLNEKKLLLEDKEVEFWKVKYSNGVLFIGDDQGNVMEFTKYSTNNKWFIFRSEFTRTRHFMDLLMSQFL